MRSYSVKIEIPEGEVKRILDELTEALDTIQKCYRKLVELGVLTVVKKDAAEDGDAKED